MFAFITLFQELIEQGLFDNFDDIVVSIATGCTAAGIAVGNYLTGSKLRIHAVSIALSKEELTKRIDRMLSDIELTLGANDIMDIIDDYIGEGYGTATEGLLETITNVSANTGILLDPYYTGKGTQGLLEELKKTPSRFQGKRILFIHTGGIFGLFNGEMDRVMNLPGNHAYYINEWPEKDIPLVQ
ncbi:hypothetical protein DPMN_148369 [Dreissena polymorpha]|nr:hypothetical protein DPMN_148369 [Dreissena polymorpha]